MIQTELLINRIHELLAKKGRVIVAIDGRCGAGKSTLAETLAVKFSGAGCDIIHMDDFYLPLSMRTAQRLSQPGGNVHYERFLEEVVPLLRSGSAGSYRIFSCQKSAFDGAGQLHGHPLVIVEGAYCMRPELRSLYDLTVFLDVDPQSQKERLLRRVGTEAFQNFLNKWIPMEETYFSFYDIPNLCDIRLQA